MDSLNDSNNLYILNFLRFSIPIQLDDNILHLDPFRNDGMGISIVRPVPQFQSRILVIDDLLRQQPNKTSLRRGE
jgi:hypothetical protein